MQELPVDQCFRLLGNCFLLWFEASSLSSHPSSPGSLYFYGFLFALVAASVLLNQVRASHRPVRAWFLKIDPVWIIGMRVRVCVRVSAPEAINN